MSKGFVIKKTTVYDGTGNRPFVSDVFIEGNIIKKIALYIEANGYDEINGEGLALCPGIIDTHSHSDLELFRNKNMMHVIRQGITTEVTGQDGSSVAPLNDSLVDELADNMAPLAGVINKPYWWRSTKDYIDEVNNSGVAPRYVTLAGHGTIRMCVMSNDNRKPTSEEMEKIRDLTAKCLEEGAKGVSFGLIYPPGSYADTEELLEVAKVVAKYDGIIMVHTRNEQDKLIESLDEMIYIMKESKVRMHISHLKALGYRNWGKVGLALEKITSLREEGYDITFDQYPYTAACTGLKVLVPMWAYDGGEKEFQNRLKDPTEYAKILECVNKNIEARGGIEKIFIATVASEENSWMSGNDLKVISEKMNLEPGVATLKILQIEGPSVVAIYFSISEDDVNLVMKSPIQGICTDGIIGTHPHPRAYGSFPRLLGYYSRKLKLMSLEEAIRKVTLEPARRLRLWDRGLVREGLSADLVLFDADKIADRNTYLNPKEYPEGIKYVWVQGELKFKEN